MTLTWVSVGGNAPLYYIPVVLTNSQTETTADRSTSSSNNKFKHKFI